MSHHKSLVGYNYKSARGRVWRLLPGLVIKKIKEIESYENRQLSLLEMEGLWEDYKLNKEIESKQFRVGTRAWR